MLDHLIVIGIMTGNSLDGVDAVMTKFSKDGSIVDIASYSISNPPDLTSALRSLRESVHDSAGQVLKAEESYNKIFKAKYGDVNQVHSRYLNLIAECVKKLIEKSKLSAAEVDLIGFHGQTCTHYPPSLNQNTDKNTAYTVQFGDGQELADITGIPVVYDFRSDDIIAGGEGAPLAPVHHEHLVMQSRKYFPVAFCNAGNTGNISLVSHNKNSGKEVTIGWDSGPFNHFPDSLMRAEKNLPCDLNGDIGIKGKIIPGLLGALFDKCARTKSGENYFLKNPPKSSDPSWYTVIPALKDKKIAFEGRLRTAEYFSVYALVHSLTLVPGNIKLPRYLALCGGGWKNSVAMLHLEALLKGDTVTSPILEQHKAAFSELLDNNTFEAHLASFYGFDESTMEARVFADAAFCRVKGEPFSRPEITGASKSCILGLIKFPAQDKNKASENLKGWLEKFNTDLSGVASRSKWSRASAGWSQI